ncbi:hypothetical protein Verru16b_03229 [Lacunisphaera limnophila]|uniref:Uncharacterized protein n=1 Tax=Lacunisphaera limnophila TaxID=1838286 RepID=A0A1D8AZ05_9BACT|nr:hypothetical protein [Lacunisphaera limnophila]AOS46133.1 hypothetical protein Verru16b_03229 [Lacunisphaera limnophila]
MKTLIIHRILLAALLAMIVAGKSLAQSEGTLILTEEAQKVITHVQERAAKRLLQNQAESADGTIQQARQISGVLVESLKAKDLEKASEAWWAGMEAGVPKTLETLRDSKLAEAREAAEDAVNLIKATVRRASRNTMPSNGESANLSGEAASLISADMRALEQEKRELNDDLRKEVDSLSNSFPEFRHVLQQSGFTSANVRELVISRLREANQLEYQAGIYAINAIAWNNMKRTITIRAGNGGNPQIMSAQNGSDVIKAMEINKFFK